MRPGIATAEFNGIIISGLDWVGEPNRVLSGITGLFGSTGITLADITFTDRTITANLSGALSGNINLNLSTTLVPLPASVLFMGSGLVGLLGFSRKNKA